MISVYLFLTAICWIIGHEYIFSKLGIFPGPYFTRFTSLILKYHEFTGNRRLFIHGLHERFGHVVRIAPNELSFATFTAAKEIYASGGAGYDKTEFYSVFARFGVDNLFSMLQKQSHAKRRRVLGDSYANSAVLKPEVLQEIQARAREFAAKCNGPVDIYVCPSFVLSNKQEWLHCYSLDCITQHLFYPYGTRALTTSDDRKKVDELSFADSLIGMCIVFLC
jgi:hypothetical protein